MSEELLDSVDRRLRRRRFLGSIGKVAFGAVAGVVASPQTAEAHSHCGSHGCAQCTYHTSRKVKCCVLGYRDTCGSLSCFNRENRWWVWSCCWGTQYTECYECCSRKCSLAYSYRDGTCGSSGSPSGSHPITAEDRVSVWRRSHGLELGDGEIVR